jgi:Na+-translocating ferredoxin:NAD+ oxidoreductase RnfG subunit
MNLFHHTLAFLVLGGLLVRTSATPRAKAALATLFGAATAGSAAAPVLVWWGVPGAATGYIGTLATLSFLALVVMALVIRDAWLRSTAGNRGMPGSDILTRFPVVSAMLLAGAGVTVSVTALPAQVLLTERQAITKVFPRATAIVTDSLRPDSATRVALERALGRALYEPVYPLRRIYEPGGFVGYTLVTEERGKYRPITMLIAVDSARRVAGVQILVYREPRGGEVAREYFLRQYRGKSIGDPIRLNRDVINISGATISVQSVSRGVRKTLALLERFYPPDSLLPAPRSLLPLELIP